MDTEKKNLILGYSDQLSQEVLDKYLDDMDNYDLKKLDMELTYEVKVSNPGMFSKTPAPAAYIPKDDGNTGSGLESLLKKYEKRK